MRDRDEQGLDKDSIIYYKGIVKAKGFFHFVYEQSQEPSDLVLVESTYKADIKTRSQMMAARVVPFFCLFIRG